MHNVFFIIIKKKSFKKKDNSINIKRFVFYKKKDMGFASVILQLKRDWGGGSEGFVNYIMKKREREIKRKIENCLNVTLLLKNSSSFYRDGVP